MQLSSAYLPLAASASHPASVPSAATSSDCALNGFSVSLLPTITAFFSSLSPAYVPVHKRQTPEFAPANRPRPSGSQAATDDVTQKVKLACNIVSSWVPSVRVASDVVATICSTLSLSRDVSQVLEGNKGGKRPSTPVRIPLPVSATLALVALDNLGAAAAVPAPQQPMPDNESLGKCGSVSLPIEVSDEDTMNSIGRNASLPSNAHYLQTRDLDGTKLNVNRSLVFDGHYDGGNHIIRNQHSCLFDRLRGTVKNLQLTGARITGDGNDTAIVVCKMDDGSIVEDIWLGNGSVTTHGPALAGLVSANRTGQSNRVSRIEIHNASVVTHADSALAGAVAGQCHGVTEQVAVHHTRVKTHGRGAHAGLACGSLSGRLESFASTCSQVETTGPKAKAGMGAGVLMGGQIKGMTVVNGSVITNRKGCDAGVGAGRMQRTSQLININTFYTKVHTTGRRAGGGIGAGHMLGRGTLTNITGVQSEVRTAGSGANAGFGVGTISAQHRLSGLTSVNNTILSENSRASITGNLAGGGEASANDTITENTFVNSNDTTDAINQSLRDSLCANADQRLVAPNCHIALPGNCAPVQFVSPPNLTMPSVTCNLTEIADVPVVAPTNSSGNHSLALSSLEPLPVTTAAPLVAGLSANAIGGIAAGSTAFVIGACIVACCCYHFCCSKDEPMAEGAYDDVSL